MLELFESFFWVILTKTEKVCAIFKKIKCFLAFLGAFDKYEEILCYFESFFNVSVAFGSFLGRVWPILKIEQKFCAFFCAIFWKLPNSGYLPKFGSRRQLCHHYYSLLLLSLLQLVITTVNTVTTVTTITKWCSKGHFFTKVLFIWRLYPPFIWRLYTPFIRRLYNNRQKTRLLGRFPRIYTACPGGTQNKSFVIPECSTKKD